MDKILKFKTQSHKTTRRKHRTTTSNIGLGNDFLCMTPKEQAKKAQIYKWDCIRQKCFCSANYQKNEKATYE